MKKIIIIVVLIVIVIVAYMAMKNKNPDSTENDNNEVASTETVNKSIDTGDAVEVDTLNKGPFAKYWATIDCGDGFAVEIYVNGTKLFSSEGISAMNRTTNKIQDMLKDGENIVTFKILSKQDWSKQFYNKRVGVYLSGTDQDKDYKYDMHSTDLTRMAIVKMEDSEISVGTHSYSFEISK